LGSRRLALAAPLPLAAARANSSPTAAAARWLVGRRELAEDGLLRRQFDDRLRLDLRRRGFLTLHWRRPPAPRGSTPALAPSASWLARAERFNLFDGRRLITLRSRERRQFAITRRLRLFGLDGPRPRSGTIGPAGRQVGVEEVLRFDQTAS